MKYADIRQAIQLCHYAGITCHIWGDTGLGKSTIVCDLAMQLDFGFIDMRLSQIEAADLRGIPDKEDGNTVYRPPVDLPVGGLTNEAYHAELDQQEDEEAKTRYVFKNQRRRQNGFLFLDELPRAQEDVQQACFQLVLNRAIGPNYVLPPGWSVVCAGNYLEGAYQQVGFTDPAFISRFSHLELSRGQDTVAEWINYMSTVFGPESTNIVQFASSDMKFLDGARGKTDLGFTIQPSRRAWAQVFQVLDTVKTLKTREINISEDAKWGVIAGLVGFDVAQTFRRYDCPIKPLDLYTHGIAKYDQALKELAKNRNALSAVMWGLISILKPNITKDSQGEFACDFADWMCDNVKERDIILAYVTNLNTKEGSGEADYIRASVLSNSKVGKLLSKAKNIAAPNAKGRSFLERITARPDLQAKLEKISWGK